MTELATPSVQRLFEPLKVGNVQLRNRLAFAPCTRQRSNLDGTPNDLNVEYYRQRAGAGLIVTEGIYPDDMGKGYLFTPGLCTESHVTGWRRVTDAVHEAGGTIFAQIMHVGRLSDPLMLPDNATPISPSAVNRCEIAHQNGSTSGCRSRGSLERSLLFRHRAAPLGGNPAETRKPKGKLQGQNPLSAGAGEGNRTLVCSLGSWFYQVFSTSYWENRHNTASMKSKT